MGMTLHIGMVYRIDRSFDSDNEMRPQY